MKNRILQIAGLIILVIGILLVIKSTTYPIYTNEQAYQEKYSDLSGAKGDSEKFYQLRDEYLTPKFELADYGITSIIFGLGLLIVSFIGINRIKAPHKKIGIVIVGIIAALLTTAGYAGNLYLGMYRDSYPHWADSLAIPLVGIPVLVFISLGWVGINLIGIRGDFKTGASMFPIRFGSLNLWYAIILSLTIILTVWMIMDGYFWQELSGFVWIYFYSSIMNGRHQSKLINLKTTGHSIV